MATNEALQQKFLLYQVLQKQMEELQKQAVVLQQKFLELETTGQAVEDMRTLAEQNETLVPLGSGIYIEGRIKNRREVLVDVGAGVVMKKSMDDAMRFLEDKKKEVEQLSGELQSGAQRIADHMNTLAPELQKLITEAQGK